VSGDFSFGGFGLVLRDLSFSGNDNRLNPLSRPHQLKCFLIVFQGKFVGDELVDINLVVLKIIKGSRKTVDLGK
jgi:hypothetical protein